MTVFHDAVETWARSLSAPISLKLITPKTIESDQTVNMASFGERFAKAAAGMVLFSKTKGETTLPFFETESGIRFHILPGPKLGPLFLAALTDETPELSGVLASMADKLTLPASLDLFVAEFCPYCPAIMGQLMALAAKSTLITLRIIDGTLFPAEAQKHGVMSAPTLIYDGQIHWSGQFDLASALEVIAGRPPHELSADAIRSMLEEGGASRVAAMIARANRPFDGLNMLLAHEKWSVRLGAMVVMEELAETHPAIVSKTAALLLAFPDRLDPSALGDVVYIAGLTGDPEHIGRLEAIKALSDNYDLREAIDEAVEEILAATQE